MLVLAFGMVVSFRGCGSFDFAEVAPPPFFTILAFGGGAGELGAFSAMMASICWLIASSAFFSWDAGLSGARLIVRFKKGVIEKVDLSPGKVDVRGFFAATPGVPIVASGSNRATGRFLEFATPGLA